MVTPSSISTCFPASIIVHPAGRRETESDVSYKPVVVFSGSFVVYLTAEASS